MRKSWLFPLATALLLSSLSSWGQRASNWRVYKLADGLVSAECTAVTVDLHTNVYVRHPKFDSATVLDGFGVRSIVLPRSGIDRVYASPGGRQIWAAYAEGLQEQLNEVWVRFPVREIAAEMKDLNRDPSHPIPLCPVRQGRVLYLLRHELMELNAEQTNAVKKTAIRSAAETVLGSFLDMTIARDGGLLITGERGLARVEGPSRLIRPDTRWQEHLLPESFGAHNLTQPVEDTDGGITAIAETADGKRKLIVHFDEREGWSKPPGLPAVVRQEPQRAWRGPLGTWWATGWEGLFQWDSVAQQMLENEEVQARRYFDLATEAGGAFWLASSDGLFRYAPQTWRNLDLPQPANFPVSCLTEDDAGRLWFATTNAVYAWQNDQWREYHFPAEQAEHLREIRTLTSLPNGSLLLESPTRGYQLQPEVGQYVPASPDQDLRAFKSLGRFRNGSLVVQSLRSNLPLRFTICSCTTGPLSNPGRWRNPKPASGRNCSPVSPP